MDFLCEDLNADLQVLGLETFLFFELERALGKAHIFAYHKIGH